MGRIRSIHPDILTDPDLTDLPRDARLFFYYIWIVADDAGNIDGSDRGLKLAVFPGDDDLTTAAVADLKALLMKKGFLVPYASNEKNFLHVVDRYWKYQRPDHPTAPKVPLFPGQKYTYHVRQGNTDPCLSPARIFKVDRYEADFLQPEEVGTYLDAALKWASRYYTLFRLGIHSGIRPGETIALKWGDIDWSGKYLHVQRTNWRGHIGTPNSGISRKVTLSNDMLAVLKEHRRKAAEEALAKGYPLSEWVFTNGAGNPMDESKVWKAHSIVLKAAGLRHIPLKNLRTTYGSLLVSAGVPMFHASKLLGHRSMETTERYYTKLAEGAASEAPEVLERYISRKSALPAHPEATTKILAKMPAWGNA